MLLWKIERWYADGVAHVNGTATSVNLMRNEGIYVRDHVHNRLATDCIKERLVTVQLTDLICIGIVMVQDTRTD